MREEGKTLLISTHMLDTAENLCDRIIVLRDGQLVSEINKEDFTKDKLMRVAVGEDL